MVLPNHDVYLHIMPPKSSASAARDFCARVRFLIDTYDEGNVSAAARRLKVSQRGLQKVYSGEVLDPRLTFIQSVLRTYHQEDPLWILLGEESRAAAFVDERVEARLQEALRRLSAAAPALVRGRPDREKPAKH